MTLDSFFIPIKKNYLINLFCSLTWMLSFVDNVLLLMYKWKMELFYHNFINIMIVLLVATSCGKYSCY